MRYVTWREFAGRMTVSVSTLKRLSKYDPRFPQKVQLSAKRVGFAEEAVDAYLSELANREAA